MTSECGQSTNRFNFFIDYNTENLCDKVITNEKGAVKFWVKPHPDLSNEWVLSTLRQTTLRFIK